METPESDRFNDAPHPRERYVFFGHNAAEQELLSAFRQNKMAQAWIIGGPEGIGKATLAWRLARFLSAYPDSSVEAVQNAQSLEITSQHPVARLIHAQAFSEIFLLRREWNEKTKKFFTEIRVDDVRKIIGAFHHSSGLGGWRIAIIDRADDLNRSAANALLKLIEEPPQKSLFLLISNQPGRLLPTLRSRCRKLMLNALSQDEIAATIGSLGKPWAELSKDDVSLACQHADGSIREALRLLDSEAIQFHDQIIRILHRLPQIDWMGVHQLAEKVTGRDQEAAYETLIRAVETYLDERVRTRAKDLASATHLIGYAQAWQEIHKLAQEAEVFNFDKKALTLGIFERLAKAEAQ